jgi:hypothetical protein
MNADLLGILTGSLPLVAIVVCVWVGGWVLVSWLRMKHGYPLETSSGQPLHSGATSETAERIKLLTTENAQLRAELGSIKDRLATMERIVTDQPSSLARDIDALALGKGGEA